ncbi:MAG: DNA polymerase III subunit gamma/tau [Clostridia bacterium]|nr:DNA polymerase III subunit gamma/tau [Clostridia bacterium]
MYTALYRKWRPQTFADVIGQNHITETLKNEIITGRLSHAYLFIGSRGTGKTTCARILAKAVNCPHVHEGEPCNACEVCKSIDAGTALDITEIDAASNNGVDNIRDLREQANFNPSETKYRVYIIDEVHMLSQGAFNALLKTLEEPPAHVKFILATTEAHKMPATILSRCQRFDFKRIGAEDMSERLLYIAEEEGISLTLEAAHLISRLSDGAMRDALSIMDQCIATGKEIDTALVGEVCGIADRAYLADTAGALLKGDSTKLLQVIETLYENACDMERYCTELIHFFRNIMVTRSVKNPEKLIICSDEEMQSIRRYAEKFTLPACLAVIDALQQTQAQIKAGVHGRTAMEMVLIKLASPDMDARDESVLKRLAALEQAVQSGAVVQAAPQHIEAPAQPQAAPAAVEPPAEQPEHPAEEPEAPAPVSEATPPAPEEQDAPEPVAEAEPEQEPALANLRQWPEILQELFTRNRLAWTILNGTTAKAVGNTVIVYGTHPSIADILAVNINAEDVLAAANGITNAQFTKVISAKDAGALVGEETPAQGGEDPLEAFLQKAQEGGIEVNFK